MPFRIEDRTAFVHGSVDGGDVQALKRIREISGIAVSSVIDVGSWSAVNDLLSFRECPLRVFPDDPSEFRSVDFLQFVPNATMVCIGNCDLTDISGLRGHPGLTSLSIGTARRPCDLEPVAHHSGLKELELDGTFVNQACIRALSEIERIVLRSMAVELQQFLPFLTDLKCLRLHLGSVRGMEFFSAGTNLLLLEIWGVRRLADLSPVGNASTLTYIELQDLPGVSDVAWMKSLPRLAGVRLENLRALKSVAGLVDSESLRQLMIIGVRLPSEEIRRIAQCSGLRQLSVPPMWGRAEIENLKKRMPECDFGSWTPWTSCGAW